MACDMTIERILAQHVAEVTFEALPPESVAAAKRSLVDTIAVAWGAARTPGMKEVERAALGDTGGGPSTVWHTRTRTSVRSAVFVNSVAAAALDYDGIYPAAAIHADIVAVPVALALGESLSASGRDVLCAIAVGGDLMCRLARATRANSGWFYTSIYGAIASAAMTARLLKPRPEVVAHAMGLGYMNSSGTYQPVAERSLSKRALAAFAAESGVLCGQLAAEGYFGPLEWLSGRYGLHALYEAGDTAAITEDLGKVYENAQISVKPYPSCQCNHAAIDALLALRAEHGLHAGNVAGIEAVISPYMSRLVGAPYAPGATPQVAAQFSIQYSLARALLDGGLCIAGIGEAAACDPKAAELASRVRVTVDPENQANYCPATVRVTLQDGTVLAREAKALRGSVDAPLTNDELVAKVSDCLTAGGYSGADANVERIVEALTNVDNEPTLAGFMARVAGMLQHSVVPHAPFRR
jgi:2-methylcitrate dehydratase PrpD